MPSGRRLPIAESLIRERLVRRWRAPDVVFAGAAAASVPVLLWFGRGLTFFSDEWAFIAERSLADPSTWWAPHNEHWSTIPILVYRALVETVGLRTYVPYLALVILLNVVVAVAKLSYGIASAFIVVAGTVRMPLKTFIKYGSIVAVLQYGTLLFAGYYLGASAGGSVVHIVSNVQYVVAFAAIAISGYYIFTWYMRQRLLKEDEKIERMPASGTEI